MNKELEAFKNITEFIEHSDYYIDCFNALKTEYHKDKRKVEQALTELQAIKEAKPSEAMECFENLRCNLYNEPYLDKHALSDCEIIKATLLKAEKLEKAWEVVKKKGVDVATFNDYQTVIEYNWSIRFEKYKRKELTQEEFDIMKEWSKQWID